MSLAFLREAVRDYRAVGSPIPTLRRAARLMVKEGGVKEGDVVADAGAGTGVIAIEAARAVGPRGHVVAVEMNPRLCEEARLSIRASGLRERVTLINGDAFLLREHLGELHGRPEVFDAVLSSVPITALPDPPSYVRALAAATRPGGRVVQETYWPLAVRRLMEDAGLEDVRTAVTFITVAPGAVVSGRVVEVDRG